MKIEEAASFFAFKVITYQVGFGLAVRSEAEKNL